MLNNDWYTEKTTAAHWLAPCDFIFSSTTLCSISLPNSINSIHCMHMYIYTSKVDIISAADPGVVHLVLSNPPLKLNTTPPICLKSSLSYWALSWPFICIICNLAYTLDIQIITHAVDDLYLLIWSQLCMCTWVSTLTIMHYATQIHYFWCL